MMPLGFGDSDSVQSPRAATAMEEEEEEDEDLS